MAYPRDVEAVRNPKSFPLSSVEADVPTRANIAGRKALAMNPNSAIKSTTIIGTLTIEVMKRTMALPIRLEERNIFRFPNASESTPQITLNTVVVT